MALKFLYNTTLGRLILKVFTRPAVSRACGRFMDTRCSKILIPGFMRRNQVDLEQLEERNFNCFNDCFTRKLKEGTRPVDQDEETLVSPCDGLLSSYHIQDGLVIPVKGSRYAIGDLLQNEDLARKYDGGVCLVFRLSTSHYHRYSYPVSGTKEGNIFIPGVLHTVRPIAIRTLPVFIENSREYTLIHSETFGDIIQMEVGALLVGKIENYHQEQSVEKGMEKGRFLYGGSTIILLVEPNKVAFDETLFEKTKNEEEVPILLGEGIGKALTK